MTYIYEPNGNGVVETGQMPTKAGSHRLTTSLYSRYASWATPCTCMYLLGTHSLVIGKHKGYSPFQTRDRAERDQIIAWTINDAQGMLHVAKGFVEGDIALIAHHYILSIAIMAGGVSDVPSKFLRLCNASETSSTRSQNTLDYGLRGNFTPTSRMINLLIPSPSLKSSYFV